MNPTLHFSTMMLVFAFMLGAPGCGTYKDTDDTEKAGQQEAVKEDIPVAVAELQPTSGNEARGRVVFRPVEEGLRVEAELEGLTEGAHGFHIHERGDCSAADASSAGGHYAPQGSPHGAPDHPPQQRHVGDLGNIQAEGEGKAVYDRIDPLLSLDGEESIVGRAVIVHAGSDDLVTQPTGAAGKRVACGVIELRADEG